VENPWLDLPFQAPYLLSCDRKPIERFNASAGDSVRIHSELLPEPFFGALNAAVVFLALNPAFSGGDAVAYQRQEFMEACRQNLSHNLPTDFPFIYLDPRFADTPGGYWWTTMLRPILDEGIEPEALSQNILCVEWFPYHSESFQPLPSLVPSQQYSFELVSKALARDALIITMRAEDRWSRSVPALAQHRRQRSLNNPRNVVVSRRNYGGDFVALVDTLRSLPFRKAARPLANVEASREALLRFAADLLGTTHAPGRLSVVRYSGRLRLEVAADTSGAIAVHLASDDGEMLRWLAMIKADDGPLPQVARADSYEAPAAPVWRYGFVWSGSPDRDYQQEEANLRAFVAHLQRVARRKGFYFV